MLLNDQHTDWAASDNDTRPAIVTLHTNGNGYWSEKVKAVQVTELRVDIHETDVGDDPFGELQVCFNTDSWRPDADGLIYTDKQFMRELRAYLATIGVNGSDCGYSEQGMQGDAYVSCDIGAKFIASWKATHKE